MTNTAFEDIKPGQHFMTVQHLGSGWAAVMMWQNNEEADIGVFSEPWQTGIGRYATQAEALAEAEQWAEADDVPFVNSI